MVALIVGMLLCLGIAVAVVGLVAVPARREGREVLTPKGEEVVALVKEKTGNAVDVALEKTGDALTSAKDKVSDVTSRPGD
jgi:hypothetical protein